MLFRSRRFISELDRIGLQPIDACSNWFACGTTGSGKTSLLRKLMQALINHPHHRRYRGPIRGVSGLWCCVKNDEAANAIDVLGQTVMHDRILRLVPGNGFTFNFVSYELNVKKGGNPASLARLLQKLAKQVNNAGDGGGNNEEFWSALYFDYLHAAIWIAWLAHRDKVTLENIHDVIASSPSSVEQVNSEAFRATACWQMLQLADKNVQGDAEDRALFKAGEFILFRQSMLGDATRGAGMQMCSSVLGSFLIEPLYSTVVAEESSFTPDMPLADYWCILDAPILVHKQGGTLFQSLITLMVQEAALTRSNPDTICAIVRDEIQYLIADIEHESMVQSVCRSSLLAHISAAQNIPLMEAAAGNGHRGEMLVRAWLANNRVRFAMANVCDRTNSLFSDLMGEFKDQFFNISEGHKEPDDFLGSMLGIKPLQFSMQQSLYKRLPPEKFLTLRRGGPEFNFLIDAYLMIGGHTFSGGLPFKKVTFSQR